jgi:hypothetical protein
VEAADPNGCVTQSTIAGIRAALEQAGAEFIPDGVRRHRATGPDGCALYEDLHTISLSSAARLQKRVCLTGASLYDEDGLPA